MRIDQDREDMLWARHAARPSHESEQALCLLYEPLAAKLAHARAKVDGDTMICARLGVLKAVRTFDPAASKPRTWVYTCVKAALLEDWRRTCGYHKRSARWARVRHLETAYDLIESGLEYRWDGEADDHTVLVRRLGLVRDHMHLLTPNERLAVLLSLDGLNGREIAEQIGVSESRGHQLLNAGVKRLQRVLKTAC